MARFESYPQGTPNWVELTTPDQRASAEFYRELFGWQVEETPIDDAGNVYLTGRIEGDRVAGITGQMPQLAGHPAFWGVYLATDDVDAAVAKVAAAGGTVEAGPFDVMSQGRMAAIKDPTDARVNLWQAYDNIGTVRANEPGTPIWNELVTGDVAAACAFYGAVLGMGSDSMDMPGGSYTTLTVDGRTVGGTMALMEGVPPHWNVYFNVVSVDDTVATAEARGARVLQPAFDAPGVGRMAFLADPHGAMFALMQNPAG